MVDPHLHLAANPQRRLQKHIQGVIDHALGGIFHRHHPVIGGTGLDLAEHFINGPHRDAVDRFAEMLERRGLGKGAFRAEKGDAQRFFQRQTGRHDLAEQPGHFFVAERPLIGFDHPPQHLRLAFRAVEIAGGAGRLLDRADLAARSAPARQSAPESADPARQCARARSVGCPLRSCRPPHASILILVFRRRTIIVDWQRRR
jgi:hypothetical protein